MSKFKTKDFEERIPVACAHTNCPHPAIVNLKLLTGWTMLCRGHYEFQAQREANEFCGRNGLLTREQKHAFCKAKMPSIKQRFGRLSGPLVREPGQDDEEIAA